jgi:hypothetical protein
MGLGSYFQFGLPQGSLYSDDARNYSPTSFLHGHEIFCDHALARRSWTFLCFLHDRAMITLWVPHRFMRKTLLCYPGHLFRRSFLERSWTSDGL